jgi:hypothetical protein
MTDDVHTADPVIFIVHVVLQVILHTEETGMAHLGIRPMMTGGMDEIGQCLPVIEGGIGQGLLIIGGIGLSPLTVGESGHYPLTVGESGHYPLTKGESGHCLHMIGGMATQDVNDQCLLKILRTGVLTDLEIDICCNL